MVFNIESSLQSVLQAAKEAHEGGYATGMDTVADKIDEALEALENVTWGESLFPILDEEYLND